MISEKYESRGTIDWRHERYSLNIARQPKRKRKRGEREKATNLHNTARDFWSSRGRWRRGGKQLAGESPKVGAAPRRPQPYLRSRGQPNTTRSGRVECPSNLPPTKTSYNQQGNQHRQNQTDAHSVTQCKCLSPFVCLYDSSEHNPLTLCIQGDYQQHNWMEPRVERRGWNTLTSKKKEGEKLQVFGAKRTAKQCSLAHNRPHMFITTETIYPQMTSLQCHLFFGDIDTLIKCL